MTEIEVTSPLLLPPADAVTVRLDMPVATVLSAFVKRAVMVAVPGTAAVASPEAVIVATWALLELHETKPVRFSVVPDEVVPMAMNWAVSFDGTDWVPGMTEIEVTSPRALPPVVTVRLAVPVATVLSAFVKRAVMVAVPGTTAVASPDAVMVATWGLLELQTTWLDTFTVAPDEVVPVAMNWVVSLTGTD
jgi:hypothetical protein